MIVGHGVEEPVPAGRLVVEVLVEQLQHCERQGCISSSVAWTQDPERLFPYRPTRSWGPKEETEMDIESTVRHSTWYRTPLGRRVMKAEAPYFSISRSSHGQDGDALRRQALADLAGLAS
jgi:hypothetical protein